MVHWSTLCKEFFQVLSDAIYTGDDIEQNPAVRSVERA